VYASCKKKIKCKKKNAVVDLIVFSKLRPVRQIARARPPDPTLAASLLAVADTNTITQHASDF
jgi:hypothetical protein